jgi:hypothetical protein
VDGGKNEELGRGFGQGRSFLLAGNNPLSFLDPRSKIFIQWKRRKPQDAAEEFFWAVIRIGRLSLNKLLPLNPPLKKGDIGELP